MSLDPDEYVRERAMRTRDQLHDMLRGADNFVGIGLIDNFKTIEVRLATDDVDLIIPDIMNGMRVRILVVGPIAS